MSIGQRGCRFRDESDLLHFPVYTKGLCQQQCRLDMVQRLCGCIPHFYPNRIENPKTVCDYKQLMNCVANYSGIRMERQYPKMP